MNGTGMSLEAAPDGLLMGVVMVALLLFGVLFNQLVQWLGRRHAGYTSLLVVVGVLITLIGVAVIDWRAAVLSLGGFAASGLPMVVGDIWRAIVAREAALKTQRDQAMQQIDEVLK